MLNGWKGHDMLPHIYSTVTFNVFLMKINQCKLQFLFFVNIIVKIMYLCDIDDKCSNEMYICRLSTQCVTQCVERRIVFETSF